MKQLSGRLVYIIFVAMSLVFLLSAALVKFYYPTSASGELFSDILKDIGIVVGAVALLNVLWGVFGGEPLSEQIGQLKQLNILMKDADKSGLAGVFAKSTGVKAEKWLDLIQNSKSQIDMCGHVLYDISDSEQLCNALVERVKRGVSVRLLINHPDNPALPYAIDIKHDNRIAMTEQMKQSWTVFQRLSESLSDSEKLRFGVARLERKVLHIALRRFDNQIFIAHYLYSKRTPDTPSYVIEGEKKPLFDTYMNEFGRLYNDAAL